MTMRLRWHVILKFGAREQYTSSVVEHADDATARRLAQIEINLFLLVASHDGWEVIESSISDADSSIPS